MDKPSVQSVLQSNTLFNALTRDEFDFLAARSRVVRAERAEVLWFTGDQVDYFGMLGEGFMKMVRGNERGLTVTIELMGPGQIFGLLGTVNHCGCPLSAVAVTDVWYARIAKSAFLEIYEKNSALKDRLVKKTSLRLHGAMDLIAKMSSGRVDERIAAVLFILAESYADRADGRLTLRVPLTRQDLADMAGTTVESCIRTMSRWQKQGLISTDHHLITIHSEPNLGLVMSR